MPERQLQNLSAPNELGAANCLRSADPRLRRCSPTGFHWKTMRLRVTASPRSRCPQFQRAHRNIDRLVNGLVGDARALGSDLSALTSAQDLSDLKMRGNLEMHAGHFEQISDCWASVQQPPAYYRTAAARARRLQEDATTPRVRQYLDKMIAHCEQLAGEVEPGSDRRYAGRTGMPRKS